MKSLRKMLAALLVSFMAVAMSGCGGGGNSNNTSNNSSFNVTASGY